MKTILYDKIQDDCPSFFIFEYKSLLMPTTCSLMNPKLGGEAKKSWLIQTYRGVNYAPIYWKHAI
jgi:hypothetical protein